MDGAHMWETEAIRETRDRRGGRPTVSQDRDRAPSGDWRTLREASEATGIPLGTLRKWCRKDVVDSYLVFDGTKDLKLVEMGSVHRRAASLGRDLKATPTPSSTASPPSPSSPSPMSVSSPSGGGGGDEAVDGGGRAPQVPSGDGDEVGPAHDDDRESDDDRVPAPHDEDHETGGEPAPVSEDDDEWGDDEPEIAVSGTEAGEPAGDEADEVPPDTMIVPIDAWNKMLLQLGNLHEAGQQLAEARERAGRAETEVQFLRERLAEIRASQTHQAASRELEDVVAPPADDTKQEPVEPETTSFWRYVARGWKSRRR